MSTAGNPASTSQEEGASQQEAPEATSTETASESNVQIEDSTTDSSKAPVAAQEEDPEEKPEAKPEVEEEDTSGDDEEDSLSDKELENLDAKVRAKISKKNREAANLRSRLSEESSRADRAEVALAAGLNAAAMKFLHGKTREELEANAEELLVMLGGAGKVTPPGVPVEKGKPGVQPTTAVVDDLDSIGSRIYSK